MITVLQPGVYTTIQDAGRIGYQRFGVPVAGAMDPFSYRLANLLIGNSPDAAVLEMTAMGPSLCFEQDTVFALAGADFSPKLNGSPIRPIGAGFAPAGSVLTLGTAQNGFRGYLAVPGGFDGEQVMGSRSTYTKAGLGGLNGRALRKGDVLRILEPQRPVPAHLEMRYALMENMPFYRENTDAPAMVRVVLGPQDGYFSREGLNAFFSETYTVTGESDRMGYRLEGPSIPRAEGMEGNILSDGVAFGSIQVPDSQKPIVMMADRQTTGGYPKLGTVISADLCRMAQLRAGDTVRFSQVSLQQAQEALLEQRHFLASLERLFADRMLCRQDYRITVAGKHFSVEVMQVDSR